MSMSTQPRGASITCLPPSCPVGLVIGAQARERSSPASDSTASRARQRASQATRRRKLYGVPSRADRRAFGDHALGRAADAEVLGADAFGRLPCGRAVGVGVGDLCAHAQLKSRPQVEKHNVIRRLNVCGRALCVRNVCVGVCG